jgi:hypothetical protein
MRLLAHLHGRIVGQDQILGEPIEGSQSDKLCIQDPGNPTSRLMIVHLNLLTPY